MRKSIFVCMLIFVILLAGCNSSVNTDGIPDPNIPDPDKIVPQRKALIEGLEDCGYTIEALTSVEGSDLIVDRVVAKKENRFIDIVYGLSSENASTIFNLYQKMYLDYYILAQNGNYVYCISDKRTFKAAGFTSTGNIGVQYIHE